MKAEPYIRPALDNKQEEALKAVADDLNAQMKELL